MDQSFADALTELLAGSGISNNALGRRIEVDPAQVGRWRKGTGLPRPENIIRIADVFGVDYQWLMGLAYPESRPKSTGPLDPQLAAFLSEIETGWHALDESERALAVRGARALFAVQPVRPQANGRRDGVVNRPAAQRHDLSQHAEHGGNPGDNSGVTLDSVPAWGVSRAVHAILAWFSPQPRNLADGRGQFQPAAA